MALAGLVGFARAEMKEGTVADITKTEATDRLFDTSASHLAELFGMRTKQRMREGREVYQSARLAGSFGQKVIEGRAKVIGRITPDTPWGES